MVIVGEEEQTIEKEDYIWRRKTFGLRRRRTKENKRREILGEVKHLVSKGTEERRWKKDENTWRKKIFGQCSRRRIFLVLRGEEEQRSKQGKMFGKENIWFTEKKKNGEGKGEKCLERENREGKVVTCLIYVLKGKVPKCSL